MEVVQKGSAEWLATMAGGTKGLGSNYISSAAPVTNGRYEFLVVNATAGFSVLSCLGGRNLLAGSVPGGDDPASGLNLSGVTTLAVGMIIIPPKGELIENITMANGDVLAYG